MLEREPDPNYWYVWDQEDSDEEDSEDEEGTEE